MEMEHKHGENCKEVFNLLSAYLDAELPFETCQEIEQHLAGCKPCIEFLESLRKTVQLCHTYGAQEVPRPIAKSARNELFTAYQKMLAAKRRDSSH
jgi:anti-sigma factor RsiW